MNQEFLSYYNKELAKIRQLGAEFAKQHPKIAGNLRMTQDVIEDPHVSRLIQAVAFLNADIRQRLDDDYPELTNALLNVLYPHYLAPIPSMSIVQFQADSSLATTVAINKGTLIETLPINGAPVRFQTCYHTDLVPITIQRAKLYGHRQSAPPIDNNIFAPASLQLSLITNDDKKTFAELAPEKLRFFLKGTVQQVYALYELLMQDTVKIGLATSATDAQAVFLDKTHLQAVGFDLDQGMVPYSARSNLAYRLLSEYFTFPEKFLFIEINGLSTENLQHIGNELNIYFYLKQTNKDLEQYINADYFALGCTPVVNLYRKTAEPITWDHTKTEYHLIPDARRPLANEIYSIDEVVGIDAQGKTHEFLPFYGINHTHNKDDQQCFWIAQRRDNTNPDEDRDAGTEMYLSLVDLALKPSVAPNWVISATTTCLNRDLPNHLPFGAGEPYLQFTEGSVPVKQIMCLTAPTPTRRQALGKAAEWRLVSHLSINHLSLMDNKEGAQTLREILRLYDYNDSEQNHNLISGVLNISAKRVMARDPSGNLNAFCQGVEITLEIDENKFAGHSLYLFGSILDRFFALYCTINSFTKLTIVNKSNRKVLQQWPARNGEQTLI